MAVALYHNCYDLANYFCLDTHHAQMDAYYVSMNWDTKVKPMWIDKLKFTIILVLCVFSILHPLVLQVNVGSL